MATGFAIRLEAVDPLHHLVGLAVRAEAMGASAVLVGDGGSGRDVFVTVAAMAVATERIALLPLAPAPTTAAVRRTGPALAALDELAGGRVVGCFPAAALRAGSVLATPVAAVTRGGRANRSPVPEGVVGVVADGDRPVAASDGWVVWSPSVVPDRVDGVTVDVVAYRLAHHDVEDLAAVAAHARIAGYSPASSTAWISPSGIMPSAPWA